jgi:hypothetical protein
LDRQSVIEKFEMLLPLAANWARKQEQRMLRAGVPLSAEELVDAKAIGVREPQRIRLLQLDRVPMPGHPMLKAAASAIQFLTPATCGLTLRYGIFVRSDCWRDRSLIAHELVHVMQYERLGGMLPFLRQYLFECVTIGYPEAPLEQEAIRISKNVVASLLDEVGAVHRTARGRLGSIAPT